MKILIWGTGVFSKKCNILGYFAGHDIVGFVDSYKNSDSFLGYIVYEPKQIKDLEFDALVICVQKNSVDILNRCLNENIDLRKVLFTSSYFEFENIEEKYLQQLMSERVAEEEFPALYKNIVERRQQKKYLSNLKCLNNITKDENVIKRIGQSHVVAWIPIELLFSEKQEVCISDTYPQNWIEQNKRWENHPIISFAPYNNLFHFFINGESYPRIYCEWYQGLFLTRGIKPDYTSEQIIEKRFREFRIMQNELNKGMSFFIEHPAIGIWNEKGYFNLTDGHHRTSFLYNSGITRIPVQVSEKDYLLWCNEGVVQKVREKISAQQRNSFYQPILNPYFLELNSERENYGKSRLHKILEFFSDRRFTDKKVVDIGANLGYMGQAFARMGADVTLVEFDSFHYELTKIINELLYTDCKLLTERFEEVDEEQSYDVAILLTVFYHYFRNETIRDKFINRLNSCINEMIIWESGDEPDLEKEFLLENTKFKYYYPLSYTFATGKFRELGVFMTHEME